MEYTLQLTDEIALQKDDLATYEGAAFTGEEYYLTVPLEHSIHIYGADFTFFTSCTCPHAYAAICYDSINYCFWVSDAQQHNVVYCLDSDLNELQCFYVQMNLTGDIQQIAYQEERDTLLLSYTDGIAEITKNMTDWQPPVIPENIAHGDMPGDKVEIGEGHVQKANVIFKELLPMLEEASEKSETGKVVITVCGGSGVGKSEIASLLSFYLKEAGIGSYTLSGDNYPHRIPVYNDAERLHTFRESALKGMVKEGTFTAERFEVIHEFQKNGDDANPKHTEEYDWYESYLRNGKEGLKGYLGTNNEIGFDEVEEIVKEFKAGTDEIWLKRMGREDTELWYEKVDFSKIQVLVIEWTHGNSDNYKGVDIPVLLNSTPQETLAHRRARNRDGATDSPFTMMVLELEQAMLEHQAPKAKIIISKSGELLSYEEYCKQMEEGR